GSARRAYPCVGGSTRRRLRRSSNSWARGGRDSRGRRWCRRWCRPERTGSNCSRCISPARPLTRAASRCRWVGRSTFCRMFLADWSPTGSWATSCTGTSGGDRPMTYTRPSRSVARRIQRGVGDVDVWQQIETYIMTGAIPADQAPASDTINQTATGGTTTSASDFQVIGGACKPMNLPALAAAREYQGQLNRVAQVKGYGKISTDGAIGPATLALHRLVQSAAGGSVMGDPSSCMGVAPDVDVLAVQIRAFADSLGAPTQVSPALSIAP